MVASISVLIMLNPCITDCPASVASCLNKLDVLRSEGTAQQAIRLFLPRLVRPRGRVTVTQEDLRALRPTPGREITLECDLLNTSNLSSLKLNSLLCCQPQHTSVEKQIKTGDRVKSSGNNSTIRRAGGGRNNIERGPLAAAVPCSAAAT